MNRCKNCIYFKKNETKKIFPERIKKYGKCECEKFVYGNSFDKTEETDLLYYMDYEWYKAFVEVGENFGCIHFKEKEK